MPFYKEAYRQAGVSYLQYSNICARALRQSMKEPFRSDHILKADVCRYKWLTYTKGIEYKETEFSNFTEDELTALNQYVASNKDAINARNDPDGKGESA